MRTLERSMAIWFANVPAGGQPRAGAGGVWARAAVLPLLIAAVWSRAWLGWWAVLPAAAVLLGTWLLPRLLPRPDTLENWASRAVRGRWIWLNRGWAAVPRRHRRMPNVLMAVAGLGLVFVLWGAVRLEPWPTVFGFAVVYLGKLWYCDRMVWLYEDVKHEPWRVEGNPKESPASHREKRPTLAQV